MPRNNAQSILPITEERRDEDPARPLSRAAPLEGFQSEPWFGTTALEETYEFMLKGTQLFSRKAVDGFGWAVANETKIRDTAFKSLPAIGLGLQAGGKIDESVERWGTFISGLNGLGLLWIEGKKVYRGEPWSAANVTAGAAQVVGAAVGAFTSNENGQLTGLVLQATGQVVQVVGENWASQVTDQIAQTAAGRATSPVQASNVRDLQPTGRSTAVPEPGQITRRTTQMSGMSDQSRPASPSRRR
ncbi:hypothetical protein [Streptomyces sp. NPDC059850]|uniref:hypothetical protein n=1 Tax=Streptomyces sp. NPDC059850 TaxID=3346970 RepID=UPI0036493985